ncbi:MAG: cyclopropane-fatty-acyl-phospholipid synthase [Parcubacteria group bacterium RIFCSPHIGHO2_01_FULL_47_10b]|nr:MAG: cyclopropane-fatty-acyl-phospholipid synthase [Parcubacteria group bacterium RIFCSPHIGHO2_01_FULL_47_10b]
MQQTVANIFAFADVKINGGRPWDIIVHNDRFYKRVLGGGLLGLGESYMDKDWDCKDLPEMVYRSLLADLETKVNKLSWHDKIQGLQAKFTNMQGLRRAYVVGEHYDIGNELYEYMLDKRLTYTCGYWRNGAKNLDEAEEAKIDLICRKIGLKKGDRVLDIGCGWGSFMKFAAEKYGVSSLGITVSKEQIALGEKMSKGLPVEFRFQDYRDPIMDADGRPEMFDHIVSVGMFEHVGPKNYQEFMEVVYKHLKPKGIFLLHTIGQLTSKTTNDPWTHKYIFPNSVAPSLAQIAKSVEGLFMIEDLHEFGTDYEPTLLAWHSNFMKHWDDIKEIKDQEGKQKYTKRFRRMWEYYLLIAAGLSRSQKATLWQIVITRGDIPGGYKSIR